MANKNSTKTRETLNISEDTHSSIFNAMSDGLAIHEVVYDSSGKAIDYIINDVNPAFEKITRLKKKSISGKKATEVYSVNEAPYLEIYAQVAASCGTASFETYFPPMNKHFHVSVFSHEKGRFATVFQDISEQKRAEEDLRVTIQRFYRILSNLHNGILLVTNENIIEFSNPSFCDMFGLKESPTELLNLSVDDLIAKIRNSYKDPDAALARIEEIVKLGEPVTAEDVEMRSDKTVLRDFIPINVGGQITGRLWNHTDITERKLISDTQSFLLSHNYKSTGLGFFESLASFLASILHMDYVCIDKLEGDKLTATTVAIFNYGKFDPNITYTLKETPCGDVVGKTICCFPRNISNLFPNDPALKELNAESYIGTTLWSFDGKPIGLIAVIGRHPLKNQHLAEVILKLVAIRAAGELERKNAEEAIIESEERFRALAENIPDMIVRFDRNLRFTYGNPAIYKRTGLPFEFFLGKTAMEYSNASVSAQNWESAAKEVLNSGEPRRVEQKNEWQGIVQVYDAVLVPEKNNAGHVSSIISIARDITEMKRAESTMRESEQKLKYHLENSPLAVVEWDKDFRILQWSAEAERIFGLRKKDVLGVRIDMLNIIYDEDLPVVQKTIARLMSGKEVKVISQNRNYTKTGQIIECIWYNSVLLDENGEMNSVMSLIEDVTILKRTEKDLLESRESYKELVTNARSMIIKLDTEGRFTFINEFALNFFGYRKEELLGKSALKTIVPEKESTGRDLDKLVENIIEDPDKYSININENIKKSGEKAWVEWHNKALYDRSGNRTGHLAIGVDITKRKKAEEALKESEVKLWSVLNATQESIYMFDRVGTIVMSNSTGISRLKKTTENEIIGHQFSEFMTPEIAGPRMKVLDEVFTKGKPRELEDERDCRIYHHNFFPVFKDDQVLFVVSYSSDITDRKRTESKLHESEDRFRTIAESLTVMISITRICDSTMTFINEPYESTFGFKKAELIEKKVPDIFYFSQDYTSVNDILKIKGIVDNMEIKVKKRDSSPFWIMTSIRTINFMGEPSYLSASFDITETKKAQEELLRLNRTLNAHSKSSQAMMHSTNEFNYLNAVCKIIIEDCGHSMVWVGYAETDKHRSVKPVAFFGFDKGYIDQMNITWDESNRGRGPTGTAIRTGKPSVCKNMLTDPEFKPWRKAALERGYASSLVLPLMSDGKPFGAISIYSKEPDSFSDPEINLLSDLADDLAYGISFLRLTEAERAAARAVKESEAKLKEMVVTKDKFFNIVAHDLKNPFTSLLGSSELLYDNINQMSSENIRKLALILNDSAKGGYAILQNLLDWSRSQTGLLKFNPEKINLKIVIDENIENLQLQVKNKDISLKSELAEDFFIHADKNMINTILRNLLSNAVKYTFRNGTIGVTVTQKPEEIIITVKDSGIGISDDKAGALFKLENSLSLPGTEKEQGTGLGLKLCKEFTEKMGGRIWVESTLGKGSKFKFTIPVKA